MKFLAATVLALSAFSAQAQCALEDVSPNSFACFSASHNDAGGPFTLAAAMQAEWGGVWSLVGKSDDPAFGPFTSNPEVTAGTLTFDAPQSGVFAITLKTGNGYNAYLFDDDVSSLSFSLINISASCSFLKLRREFVYQT